MMLRNFWCHSGLLLIVGLNILSHPNRANSQSKQSGPDSLRKISLTAAAVTTNHSKPDTETSNREDGDSPAKHNQHAANLQSQDTNALLYLRRYGYMPQAHSNPHEANNLISEESFSEATMSFQRFAGLPETGTIDNQTLSLMRMPRCGNVDKDGQLTQRTSLIPGATAKAKDRTHKDDWPSALLNFYRNSSSSSPPEVKRRRRKRYALQGSKWRRQELTYRISQYPTRFGGVKRHEVDAQIEKAFGIWSQVAPINFVVKKEGRVHIDIRFASGDHGDGDAFDGPGNTLAHAYFPQYGGDAHFDDQEYWTIDSYTGTNIFQVAAHELGHSLGLGHSNVREALMAPFYQKYKPNFKLHVDDILAIQALYGEKTFLPAADVPPQSPNDIGSSSSSFDSSSSSSSSGHRGHPHHPYQPTTTTTTPTPTTTTASPTTTTILATPQSPSLFGPRFMFGLSPPIDSSRFNPFRPPSQSPTSVNRHDKDARHHQGGDHEGANENGIDSPTSSGSAGGESPSSNSPSSFPADLCTDPAIDAVTRTEDGRSYVFRGDYYWLLTSDGVAKDYPRKISLDWEGLPGSLDAALTWADGKTFFFKGNKYWRFRNKRRDVGYPKLISAGFAGIPDDIDAAFVWSGNGRTYIFKGTEYWRFDSKADPPVSAEYPRSIRVWNGVPYHVNAAFRWDNNVTYFFKGSQYYRFNDKDFKVETRGKPPFPRSSADWWFGCVNTNLAQKALPSPTVLGEAITEESSGLSTVQMDTDWSYLAGLEDNTRVMGTHISDHRPASFSPGANSDTSMPNFVVLSVHGIDNREGAEFAPNTINTNPATTTVIPRILGAGRIGLFNPSRAFASSSSSSPFAAIFGPSYCIQILALAASIFWANPCRHIITNT